MDPVNCQKVISASKYLEVETQKASQKYKGDVPKASKGARVTDFSSPRGAQPPITHTIHPTGPHASNYQSFSYSCASGSRTHSNDLEPHAGYIPVTNHARRNYVDNPWRTAPYSIHRINVPDYVEGPSAPYDGYASYTVYQSVYAYPPGSRPYPSDGLQNYPRR